MPRWRALLLVLVALLFGAGTMARAAPAATPPCHETAGHEDAGHHQQKDQGSDMLAVGCCVGCMPAPATAEAAPGNLTARADTPDPGAVQPLRGLDLAPEPHPPRTLA